MCQKSYPQIVHTHQHSYPQANIFKIDRFLDSFLVFFWSYPQKNPSLLLSYIHIFNYKRTKKEHGCFAVPGRDSSLFGETKIQLSV